MVGGGERERRLLLYSEKSFSTSPTQALRFYLCSDLGNYIFPMQIAPLNFHRQADGGPVTLAAFAASLQA